MGRKSFLGAALEWVSRQNYFKNHRLGLHAEKLTDSKVSSKSNYDISLSKLTALANDNARDMLLLTKLKHLNLAGQLFRLT